MQTGKTVALGAALLVLTAAGAGETAIAGTIPAPQATLETMKRAADWQLANPSGHARWEWTQAAYYVGLLAFGELSPDSKYLEALRSMGEENAWRPGLRPGHADDSAVIWTYAKLYERERDRRLLAPSLALADFLQMLPHDESLTWGHRIEEREWSWCDALFMAPPSYAALTTATGDRRYLELANRLWWKTTDFLYDREEHLYFRDSRFFDQREPNGRKVFWSRGNGWVFAGLARMLGELPLDHPDRARYLALYREMAEKVAAVQSPDGYWRSSLLDPESRPKPETSGTGLFTYGLAWGINQGLLDRAIYLPHVLSGWAALASAVHEDGMLGWVQRIGDRPGATTEDTTEVYGAGALLLAGSEVFKLALFEQSRELVVDAANTLDEPRSNETLELPWAVVEQRLGSGPAATLVVVDARSGALVASQPFDENGDGRPERLLFQASFLARERRSFVVRRLTSTWTAPFPTRASGRFVPERKDDFAWENDRMAYRIYGPALAAGGEVSSGIDIWAKRVRHPVIDAWYKTDDYHRDHGEGLDFYKVGPSRGCGGISMLEGDTPSVAGNFKTWRLLSAGPVRVTFEVTYDAWGLPGKRVTQTRRVSLDAGQGLNRIEDHFAGAGRRPLPLAVGVALHPVGADRGDVRRDEAGRFVAYWEPPQGDSGQIGCGVLVPEGSAVRELGEQIWLTTSRPADKPFVYWAGATWSKGLDQRTPDEWRSYLEQTERRLAAPIVVQVESAAR
jgi:unsaturated rhamnogalacturonyl hydrolase